MKTKMFGTLTLVLALGVFTLAGCESTDSNGMTTQSSSSTSMGMVNDTCPFSDQAVDANSATVQFQGQSVGLCCDGCAGRWNKWSDQQKADYITSAMKK